jgi:hypothetical protein
MQTPVSSTETRDSRSTWLWGTPLLTEMAVPPFLPGGGRLDKSVNLK